jgi:thymidine kinase
MLHLTLGCMYSGKTTALIRESSGGLVIDYATGSSGTLQNHNGVSIPCVTTTTLSLVDVSNYTKILINEAQFFNGLVDFVQNMLRLGKTVHVYGLDGDFKQMPFGEILQLIPIADTYSKLYAVCERCSGKASFSKRLSSNKVQYGPHDSYIPVCRTCLNC